MSALEDTGPPVMASRTAEPEPVAETEPEPVAETEPEPVAETEAVPVAEPEEHWVDVSALIDSPVDERELEEVAAEAAAFAEAAPEEHAEAAPEPEPARLSLEDLEAEGSEADAATAAEASPTGEKPFKTVVIPRRDEFFTSAKDGSGSEGDDGDGTRSRPRRDLVLVAIVALLLIGGLVSGLVLSQGNSGNGTATDTTTALGNTTGLTPGQLASRVSLKLGDMPAGWVASATTGLDPLSTPAYRNSFVGAHPLCRSVLSAFSTSFSPTTTKTDSYRTPTGNRLAFGEVETSVGIFSSAAPVRADLGRAAAVASPTGVRCLGLLVSSAVSRWAATAGSGAHYVARLTVRSLPTGWLPLEVRGSAFQLTGTVSHGALVYPVDAFIARLGASNVEATLLTASIANGGPGSGMDHALAATLAQRIEAIAHNS